MSLATAAAATPQKRPRHPEQTLPVPQRRLTSVPAPRRRRRPKLVYALVALAGAALIAAAQIGLSLAITNDSYALADLNSQQRELTLQAQALKDDLAGVSSPQLVATKAAELGLVVAGSATYLRLSDGAVIGANSAASSQSTVNPTGSGAVHNALLENKAQEEAAAENSADVAAGTAPAIPPSITEGLPSPTTH